MEPERYLGQNLVTIAHLCGLWQAPYSLVRRALDDTGAQPAVMLNTTAYYTAADVERAAAYLQNAVAEGQRIAARAKDKIEARGKG